MCRFAPVPFRMIAVAAVVLAVLGGCAAEGPRGGAPSRAPGECAVPDPGWIWCDDFEEDRLAAYFEYNPADGAFVRADGVGLDGSRGMRVRYRQGEDDAGALHLAFGRTPRSYFRPVDEGSARYTEIFWRVYLKLPEGWVGDGGNKLSRAMVFASPEHWGQAAIAHVWSGGAQGGRGSHLVIDPASGTSTEGALVTTGYNDFPNLRWLGLASSRTPVFEPPFHGEWHCIEAQARLNAPGRGDGAFRLWIDGERQAERVGIDWVGSFQSYGWNALFLENYWDNGAPVDQERYLDNLVVSTEPIGCGAEGGERFTPP